MVKSLRKSAGIMALNCAMILGWLLSGAFAQEVVTTRATGVGAILGDVGQARDEALRDALRRAVEQALGAAVQSRTLMVDFMVVEDRVLSEASGFVRSYDIIDEVKEDDLYRITIAAQVDKNLLIDDLEGFGALLRTTLGNPRVLIVVDDASSTDSQVLSVAEQTLTSFFVEREFFVVSAEQTGVFLALKQGDITPGELANYARGVSAEVVIHVTTDSQIIGTRPTTYSTLYSARAIVNLEAILASTGQVIASQRGSSAEVKIQEVDAESAATESALNQILPRFTLDLVGRLNTSLANSGSTKSLRIVITNIPDYSALVKLRSELEQIRGVTSVQQRRFEANEGTLDVQGSVTTDDIALRMTSLTDLRLNVVFLDAQRIELQVNP